MSKCEAYNFGKLGSVECMNVAPAKNEYKLPFRPDWSFYDPLERRQDPTILQNLGNWNHLHRGRAITRQGEYITRK